MNVKDLLCPRGSRRRDSVQLRRSTIFAERRDGSAYQLGKVDPFISVCFAVGTAHPRNRLQDFRHPEGMAEKEGYFFNAKREVRVA